MSVPELQCPSSNKTSTDPLWGVVRLFSGDSDFHPEPSFDRMLYLERKRMERSRRPFMLLLLNVEDLMPGSDEDPFVRELEIALSSCVRETDIKGWCEHGKVAGIILTGLHSIDEVVKKKIFLKIQDPLVKALGSEAVQKIRVSYHVFPESSNGNGRDREWFNTRLHTEVTQKTPAKKIPRFIKRGLDIAGSFSCLVILSPAFLIIVLGIKLTSKGPVLFKEDRLGQRGKTFTSLKFRSMYVNNDDSSPKEYLTKFITGGNGTSPAEGRKRGEVVYKMARDRRITPLGNILRKTCMDELPQLINVLKGEISLLGGPGDRHPASAGLTHARPKESSG
jgi:lipopolysaccharide/colanic/teichoic acid biosynthesis glycosyltransferase